MIRKFISFFYLIFVLALCSCSNSQSNQPKPLYNEQDSIEVNNMVEQYFGLLSAKDYDKALDMLSEIKNDTIRPLLSSTREIYRSNFETFPVLEYNKVSMDWKDMDPIVLTYDIVFAKGEDGTPYKTKSVLQPIRVNGEWYLMLYQASVIN